MSSTLKINLELLAPVDPQKRQALSDTIKMVAEVWAEAWEELNDAEDEAPIQTRINVTTILSTNGSHQSTQIKAFTRKFSDGRTIRFTPAKPS